MTTPSTETTIEGRAEDVTDTTAASRPASPTPPRGPRNRRGLFVGALAVPLALGAVGFSLAQNGEPSVVTPVEPKPISALADSGAIAAKGEVAEIFGNKFVLQDGSGRALVETGREGEDGKPVTKGETVTVQGRFAHGFLKASLLTHGDGKLVRLGPAGGAPPGTLDWAKDKVGLGAKPDVPALTKSVEAAGYSDVRVAGRGPRHLEVAAKNAEGQERTLHVGFDGKIRERPDR